MCVNCFLFAELLRARGAKLKTLTLTHNSSSQEGFLGRVVVVREEGVRFFVLRGKLLLQKNIASILTTVFCFN